MVTGIRNTILARMTNNTGAGLYKSFLFMYIGRLAPIRNKETVGINSAHSVFSVDILLNPGQQLEPGALGGWWSGAAIHGYS